MIILGIDPGTATTGFAIINREKNLPLKVLNFGVITTSPKKTDAERLCEVAEDLEGLIKKYKPEKAGVEKLYFETNQKTAMTVSQARGVILFLLTKNKIPTHEFTPLQVKNTTCGYGKADKKQMQLAVKKLFNLNTIPKPDDAADALAIAFCTAFQPGNRERGTRN